MSELRHDELWAQQVVAEHLGIDVEQHDDGSRSGMYDLSLVHGGRRDALEVTAVVDGAEIALWKSLSRIGPVPTITGRWVVRIHDSAQGSTLEGELLPVLKELEEQGCTYFSVDDFVLDGSPRASLQHKLEELKVQDVEHSGTGSPGRIRFERADFKGGFVDQTCAAIAPWVSDYLASSQTADVRKKLGESGAVERHAFVIVPMPTTAPDEVFLSLISKIDQPPQQTPNLPDEITHVWVSGYEFERAVVFFQPESGWEIVRGSSST